MLSTWFKNENMKSSCQKEESDKKKRYVFFSDPDVIVKRAETSAVAAQISRDFEAQQLPEKQSADLPVPTFDIKNLENLLSYHPVQPYPFTFISAVKQKLALENTSNVSTKSHNLSSQPRNDLASSVLKTNSKQNLYQVVQKMDFVRPLKVPDLKISPKTLDFSSRENSISKELLPSTICEIPVKELRYNKSDKMIKIGERVQRKLDFSSSDGSLIINNESVEPLKAPNVSIASNLSKKKEHIRDSSREKENRSKRMKKDESLCTKDESALEIKRNKSPRHVSRKDAVDNISGTITRLKNDRLPFHTAKNIDSLSAKSRVRNFITSTAKKDSDKRQRSFNVQSIELARDVPLESKSRICGNKAVDSAAWKIPDKVTRDNSNMAVLPSNIENKSKDVCHLKQEDLKYKCDSDNRQLKQDKLTHKEQIKRIFDKNKMFNNKTEGKIHSATLESLEDIGWMSETNSSKSRISVYHVSSVQQSKSKDPEIAMESKQNINSIKPTKTLENLKGIENSATQSTSTSTKRDEELYSQSVITTEQTTTNDDINVNTFPETLFDPRRISFRDGYQQEEFHNLTTPDQMDLISKFKQRRYLGQNRESEVDAKNSEYKPIIKSDKEQEKMQELMHPIALHERFQAELNFYDFQNESIMQLMDVEKCLYNTKCEQEQKNLQKVNEEDEEVQVEENLAVATIDNDVDEKTIQRPLDFMKKDAEVWKSSSCNEAHFAREHCISNQGNVDKTNDNFGKFNKAIVKVAEVQTQTVNDMATQTDIYIDKWNVQNKFSEIHGIRKSMDIHKQSFLVENEIPQLSLDSAEQFENLDQIEEISLPSRIRTMSEISLHETTSSIKTETGTEISISTRDVTCSFKGESKEFNKYLDLEIAQLINDEEQRYDKFEMMFKSREKTLNDRTKKLAKLEEQKRALRDTGQDSRISSVKKKQRAILLKLEQEQKEMNRLKEWHVITSQERKLMFQKQRDMIKLQDEQKEGHSQMSAKNILTKLKRSADNQSPRRLSGPMKGYDIRSNSSMSSLIDSDKSQHDRVDARLQASESDRYVNMAEESNVSVARFDDLAESNGLQEKNSLKSQKEKNDMFELKSRKYEEKMPRRADILRLKQSQLDIESKWSQGRPMKIKRFLESQKPIESQLSKPVDALVLDYVKSESDTLVEELSKRSRTQMVDPSVQMATISREKDLTSNIVIADNESTKEEMNSKVEDTIARATKSSQVSEDILQTININKNKKIDKSITSDRDVSKKLQHNTELRASSKRKSSKYPKAKSSSTLMENLLRSKSNAHVSEELIKHHDKRTRLENELLQLDNNDESSVLGELDHNESQSSLQALVKHSNAVKDKNSKLLNEIINDYESKENISNQISSKKVGNGTNFLRNERTIQNISTSQINAFAISRHSSEESEKNCTKSIVVRSQDRDFKASKKFEQILTARETALASRKNCVEEWLAWHTRLRAEENRIFRMEQTALKLVAATSNVLSQQDTTISSDTTDVEGRIEILTEKLAERRIEMARLKREARKQAKQKLRTLEANLLNQLKKYDTNIYEMRKKLESKKAIKDNDKLAIEPKSLADFKVPEIPLKKIQDIYRNSDLLRSRSESDLLSARNQQRDLLKIVTPIVCTERYEKNNSRKSTKSASVRSTNNSELKSITDTNHSARTTLDDYTSAEANEKSRVATSSNDVHYERRYTVTVLDTDEKQLGKSDVDETKRSNISREDEDVRTTVSMIQSESEVQTKSDARSSEDHSVINTESADNRLITHTSVDQPQLTTQSEIIEEIENIDYSKSIASNSNYATESAACVTSAASSHDILTVSRKLDSLKLNNKTLSEDISSLENKVKVLSEIMSRLNDKTKEEFKADNNERSTSQDISEIMSKSVHSDEVANIRNEEERTRVSPKSEINTESLTILTSDGKSLSPNDLSRDKHISERMSSEVSAIIPEEIPTLSDSVHEIDYEAKSKEIMNEIEKSILSEHTKVARGDYNVSSVLENDMQNLCKDNEELFNDLVSLQLDIKYRQSIIDESNENVSARSDLNETKIAEDHLKDPTKARYSSELSERCSSSMYSPIIAGHRSKESYERDSQDDSRSARSVVSSHSPRSLAGDIFKLSGNVPEVLETETGIVDNMKASKHDEDIQKTMLLDNTISKADQTQSRIISAENISLDKDDWTTSDSFEAPQDATSNRKENIEFPNSRSYSSRVNNTSNNFSNEKNASLVSDNVTTNREIETNLTSNVHVSTFVPEGRSTNIEMEDVTFKNATAQSYAIKSNDELDDILDIIARENDQRESISRDESEKAFDNIILNDSKVSVNNRSEVDTDASMLDNRVQGKIDVGEDISDIASTNISNDNKSSNCEEITDSSLQAVDGIKDKSVINIDLRVEFDNKGSLHEAASEVQEIIITELDSDSTEDHVLPELEIDAKVELAEEEEESISASDADESKGHYAGEGNRSIAHVEIRECLEPIMEQDSSDGEQLDNLVEVAENALDTIEKIVAPLRVSAKSVIDDTEVSVRIVEEARKEATSDVTNADITQGERDDEAAATDNAPIIDRSNKTFDIVKDPDYEDISEESLEVSEILDKNELPKASAVAAKKSASLPDKYQATQKSEEVLRILDEISQKSSPDSASDSRKDEGDAQSITEEISELLGAEVSTEDNVSSSSPDTNRTTKDDRFVKEYNKADESRDRFLERAALRERHSAGSDAGLLLEKSEEKSDGDVSSRLDEGSVHDDKSSRIIYELRERVTRLQEQDGSSESSEAGDTPRGVSEIEMDSPRDFNDSKLDIDILDDDLLSGGPPRAANQSADAKTNFHSASIAATSEKDIETMIDKLKASLEQPGLEVAELEAKLLRIEQLQIELEIKKLEAEEVSYYVREIPNKPPPPYTPPGDSRLSTSLGSPSPLNAVIPSNLEELISFTEKATVVIFNAKSTGEDITSLEAPPEIYELTKEKNEVLSEDRQIYNTFLFDLCKEIIVELYRVEYETPGPSWTKPSVKTKPTMNIPRTMEELIEHVNKEIAMLFGFKTKLQRENMVMRWSRKRRDRVDELLAREAQAEEDEWTKFHHDKLAVKNGLTITILDTLLMETTNVVKIAYDKKRRLMV